jgi:hypothetical protein
MDMDYVPGVSELEFLQHALRVLAASPAEQVAWLEATEFGMEEMVLSFDDAVDGRMPTMEREGVLPGPARERVDAVSAAIGKLRQVPGLEIWVSFAALGTAPEWGLVRQAAQGALDVLGTGGEETGPFAWIGMDQVLVGLRRNVDFLAEPPDRQGEMLDAYPSGINSVIIGLHDLLGVFRSRLEAPGVLEPDVLSAILVLDRAAQDLQATAPGAPVDRAGLDTDAWRGLRDQARGLLAVYGDTGKERTRPEPRSS